jgi:hypothetical protein
MILWNRLGFLFFWQVGWVCTISSFSDDSVEPTLVFVFLASWVGMHQIYFSGNSVGPLGFLFFWQVGSGYARNSFSDDSVELTLVFVFLASWVWMPPILWETDKKYSV